MKIFNMIAFCALISILGVKAKSQEINFLALQGDGSASVILDRAAHTAFINDGGRAGMDGMAAAEIEGQPVFEYLRVKGITRVIFSCSHPHDDHMGAIEKAVKSPEVLKFQKLAFVDSILPGTVNSRGKPIVRLQNSFLEAHGKEVANEKLIISTEPAVNADRFAEIAAVSEPGTATSVSVENYRYNPGMIGEDIHDMAMIVQTRVSNANRSKVVIDFDDASKRLIKKWAADPHATIPDVVVVAHHGSRYNNMSAVLKQMVRGRSDLIFTVNASNRFLHPTPEALDQAINAVGVDHVHLTGSRVGDNVVITPEGIPRRTSSARQDLISLIDARVARADELLRGSGTKPQTRERALKDRRALAKLAQKHDLNGNLPPEPYQTIFGASGQTDTGFGDSAPGVVSRGTGPKLDPSGGGANATSGSSEESPQRSRDNFGTEGGTFNVGGTCECGHYRNHVLLYTTTIVAGRHCGHDVCGR